MRAATWTVALSLAVLAGCGSMLGKDSGPTLISSKNAERLQNREWELKTLTVSGTRIIMHPDYRMTIIFSSNGEVGGYGAVNQFRGTYKVSEDGALSWPAALTTTRKAGPPELMEKERSYLSGIPKTNRAIVSGTVMQLQSDDGNTVLAFIQAGT
jgi:heat shock protein HslJ